MLSEEFEPAVLNTFGATWLKNSTFYKEYELVISALATQELFSFSKSNSPGSPFKFYKPF